MGFEEVGEASLTLPVYRPPSIGRGRVLGLSQVCERVRPEISSQEEVVSLPFLHTYTYRPSVTGKAIARRFAAHMPRLALAIALGLSLSLLASGCGPASTQPVGDLHVLPFPDTPDASPRSEVVFMALRPSDIGQVTMDPG